MAFAKRRRYSSRPVSEPEIVQAFIRGQISRRVFMRRMLASGVSFAAALSYANLLAARPAGASTQEGLAFYTAPVFVFDNRYVPRNRQARQGATVPWHFENYYARSVTDQTGLGLFDSGPRTGGARFEYTFEAAGQYPYRNTAGQYPSHSTAGVAAMTGQVNVPLKFRPQTGPLGTRFSIEWAASRAPSGYVYDVQVKGPSDSGWTNLAVGTAGRRTRYSPTETGTHVFRMLMRRLSNGATSGRAFGEIQVT